MSQYYGSDPRSERSAQEREERAAREVERKALAAKTARSFTISGAVGLVVLVAVIFGSAAGCRSYGRYQNVQDANNKVKTSQIQWKNKVKLNEIEISQQAQRVKIEKQKAEIRRQKAIGIREAQDTINKTLTPLYVQHEMVETLGQISRSGKNNTVIYIPVGPDGLPVVATEKR